MAKASLSPVPKDGDATTRPLCTKETVEHLLSSSLTKDDVTKLPALMDAARSHSETKIPLILKAANNLAD